MLRRRIAGASGVTAARVRGARLAVAQLLGADEGALAIGRHDLAPGRASGRGIAVAAFMLAQQAFAVVLTDSGTIGLGLGQHLHGIAGADGEQAQA